MDILNTLTLCLALNVYHEARGEPEIGQYAVAYVTINRAKKYKSNVCQVVFEKKQFSWANRAVDKNKLIKAHFIPKAKDPAWIKSMQVATSVLESPDQDPTNGALWYHAKYIKKPIWSARLNHTATLGKHIFYKAKG